MAATELATAYLSLVPSMKGAQGKIASELASVDADGIGKGIGSRMGGGISGTLKGLVGPALAGLAAVGFGGYIAEAARASDATDKFKGTLNFAGLDTSAVEAATKAAKSYADETVYDLSDIQSTMATLAANGVKDYTGITQAAGNLNAVAGGNAETFKSVSRALGQSAGAGKLMTEDWNMLADAIPGASGELQKAMKEAGAFEGNFKKAMETGEITADEFQAAIVKLGDTPIASEAARSVTTFEGALGNLSATVNSGLMAGLDALKPAITGAINGVSAGLQAGFDWIGNAVTGLRDIIVNGDFTGALREAFGLEEDSPAVDWMLRTRAVFAEGIPGLISLFRDGDFTGHMSAAFGLEEDSPAVDFMFKLREDVQAGLQGVKDFVLGFKIPMDALLGAGVDVSPMMAAGGAVRDTLAGLWETVKPLIPTFAELWSSLSPLSTIFAIITPFILPLVGILGELAATLGGALMTAITSLMPAFQSIQSVVVSLFQDVLTAALPVVVQLVGMFSDTLAQILPILIPIIATVIQLAATLIGQLAPIFMELVSAVLPMVVTILGAVFAAIGPVVQIVAGLLIPIIQALMPIVVTVFSVVVDIITAAMQIVMGIIQVVTGIISGNWDQVWAGIGNIFSGIWALIISVVSGAIAIVRAQVMAGLGFVSGFISGALSNIGGFFADTWANVTNGASGMIGGVVGFFTSLPGRILGALGSLGSTLYNAGRDIVQGLINGIGSMLGAIGRAVLNIVPEAIRGPFEDLMGIRSPSRVAMYWGHMIGGGLIGGIEDMYDPVAEATALLMAAPEIPSFASTSNLQAYAAAAQAPDTGGNGDRLVQNVYPSEKMSEENLANVAARKITGALV